MGGWRRVRSFNIEKMDVDFFESWLNLKELKSLAMN
jgi:hypothetical protein